MRTDPRTDMRPSNLDPEAPAGVSGAGTPAVEAGLRSPRPSALRWLGPLVVAITFVVGTGLLVFRSPQPDPPMELTMTRSVTAEAMDQQYGIHIDLVGVSAAGGMVDLRFTVSDPKKALPLFEAASDATGGDGASHEMSASAPVLVVPTSNAVIHMTGGMGHHPKLVEGGHYFMLYPNPAGSIQDGTSVSVVIGDIRLDGMIATT